ncbi:MAG: hypothetical protein U5L00_06715 [Desulfovermiculus sp.]|nr:hypothetical protein [Desulfovermiculus sp.]
MTKQKTMDRQLLEEVQPQIQEILDQIHALEQEAQNKRVGIQNFKREIEQRQIQVRELRTEAERALGRGEDPMPSLDQVASLENEIRVMQGLLENNGEADSKEKAQIEQLRKDLQQGMQKAVNQSETVAEMREGLEDRLRDLQQFMEAWRAAEKELFKSFGVPIAGSRDQFSLKDKDLRKFCQFSLARL